jgi:hypothetical protein
VLETCIDPQEIGCNRGHEFLEECPHWNAVTNEVGLDGESDQSKTAIAPQIGTDAHARHLHLPWTANSLGLLDLELATACNQVTLIGIIGAYNAGKTSLLTLIYLLTTHGQQWPVGSFAGSLTLVGWENLAANFRWATGEGGPKFPPHTSLKAGPRPGLLHLALRDAANRRRDFLLTDPPGEWFNSWAQNDSAESAEGARWVHRYADRFLFLVDREALAGNERGKKRDALRDLARRLSKDLRGRSVAIVWSKSDVQISATIEDDLKDCFATEFPGHAEFRVRMRFGDETRQEVEEPALALMGWAFASERKQLQNPLAIPACDKSDLFLSYRGLANDR